MVRRPKNTNTTNNQNLCVHKTMNDTNQPINPTTTTAKKYSLNVICCQLWTTNCYFEMQMAKNIFGKIKEKIFNLNCSLISKIFVEIHTSLSHGIMQTIFNFVQVSTNQTKKFLCNTDKIFAVNSFCCIY